MTEQTLVKSTYAVLGTDPDEIKVAYFLDDQGRQCAMLHIGNQLTLNPRDASPAALRALAAAALELADRQEEGAVSHG